MKDIAKTEDARFQWWIQKTFHVLPTDERFMALTDEQLELLYENFSLDIEEMSNRTVKNPVDNSTKSEEPIENESYFDPDFNSLWNELEEYPPDNFDDDDMPLHPMDINSSVNNFDDWEEV